MVFACDDANAPAFFGARMDALLPLLLRRCYGAKLLLLRCARLCVRAQTLPFEIDRFEIVEVRLHFEGKLLF